MLHLILKLFNKIKYFAFNIDCHLKFSQDLGRANLKLQLHKAIYRLRSYSNLLIHILSLSNSHNNVASLQKNQGDKSHRVIVA